MVKYIKSNRTDSRLIVLWTEDRTGYFGKHCTAKELEDKLIKCPMDAIVRIDAGGYISRVTLYDKFERGLSAAILISSNEAEKAMTVEEILIQLGEYLNDTPVYTGNGRMIVGIDKR